MAMATMPLGARRRAHCARTPSLAGEGRFCMAIVLKTWEKEPAVTRPLMGAAMSATWEVMFLFGDLITQGQVFWRPKVIFKERRTSQWY